ncbi:MAG TPA: M56 and DUF3738 domain-containing protein [Bryobacteraceae bacterium]|jgi:uncharacterized protein (TIGR03435 family)|nr:M56 and DUF3738 domain-containing protein [Bryobacteraceae bacterium]
MTNHLWQSTLFAAAAGLLSVGLRSNRAQVRFWIWFSTSIKFLIPFTLLMNLGSHLHWEHVAAAISAGPLPFAVRQIAQPFPDTAPFMDAAPGNNGWLFVITGAVWACGFTAIGVTRLRNWQRIRAALRSAVPIRMPAFQVPAKVRIRSTPGLLEPGVIGVLRPILFLPAGISERLSARQMEAILIHELCHIRRRDNLWAAIHMTVEAIFWFHPLVWWIGARLVEERERACDEAVLSQMREPRVYAEGILSVCKFYRESPLVCVSGVTGADLRKRIEAIMANRIGRKLNRANKFLLAGAGVAAVAVPLMVGIGNTPPLMAQSPAVSQGRFDVAAIRVNNSGANILGIRVVPGGGLRVVNATLKSLIAEAYQVRDFEISGGPVWLGSTRYDIEAKGQIESGGTPVQSGLQVMKMLQELLADRFDLRIHRERKEMPIYGLLVTKNGPRLEASRGVCFDPTAGIPPPPTLPGQSPSRPCGGFNNSSGQMLGAGVAMPRFAANLARFTGRTVVDKTELKGSYDIALRWAPSEGQAWLPTGPLPPDDSQPSIFTALQEQLGLRLEAQRGPVEVLVIDRAEKPSEN